MRPSGAGLGNVHFQEYTFVLFFGQKFASLQFFMLFHLRSGPQFAGAQAAMGQFTGGQYAGETANWALESEGPNLPGLRFVLSLTRFTGPSTPTVIDRPVPELGEVGSRVAAASCLLLNK